MATKSPLSGRNSISPYAPTKSSAPHDQRVRRTFWNFFEFLELAPSSWRVIQLQKSPAVGLGTGEGAWRGAIETCERRSVRPYIGERLVETSFYSLWDEDDGEIVDQLHDRDRDRVRREGDRGGGLRGGFYSRPDVA